MIDFSLSEKKIYSQNGEDGVIEHLFKLMGTTNKFFVEFGVENGTECNTRYVEEYFGFSGIRFDSNYEDIDKNIFRKKLTRENILDVFGAYNIPLYFDLLSIDVDSNDFYLWKKISEKYNPRIVIIEYNSIYGFEDKIITYNPDQTWDYTDYFGAGILPLFQLGQKLGYDLVYGDKKGINLFFVRKECLKEEIKNKNDIHSIYQHTIHYKNDMLNRTFISYDTENNTSNLDGK